MAALDPHRVEDSTLKPLERIVPMGPDTEVGDRSTTIKKPGPVIHLKPPQIKNPEPDTPTAPTTADRLRKIASLMDEGREPKFVIAGLQMILNHLKGVSGIKVSRKKHKNRR